MGRGTTGQYLENGLVFVVCFIFTSARVAEGRQRIILLAIELMTAAVVRWGTIICTVALDLSY